MHCMVALCMVACHGCSWGGMVAPRGACMVAPGGACVVATGGACLVALEGACVVALGGHAWLLRGVCGCCGGVCGCSGGHAWLLWGWMVAPGGGVHPRGGVLGIYGDTV